MFGLKVESIKVNSTAYQFIHVIFLAIAWRNC